ncbi:hypothetical protein ACUHGC_09105 [Testudinibacter sp. P27/CKL/0425]
MSAHGLQDSPDIEEYLRDKTNGTLALVSFDDLLKEYNLLIPPNFAILRLNERPIESR